MAGLYFHIPFCRKACHYCNFHFSTSLHRKPEMMEAIYKQVAYAQWPVALPPGLIFDSLYIGGGTPSLLSPSELETLLLTTALHWPLKNNAEITLEVNPDDITPGKLQDWKRLGINRLSIGVQSFREADLRWMNRAHTAKQAEQSIEWAASAGFNNLTIDLIYGTPSQTDEAWQQNLEKINKLGINHLSCYALTVEENTALHHFIKKGKVPPIADENQARQFEILTQWASTNGWEHYEISNFCKPGNRSRHNSAYWTGAPYLGFGPSAHSFDGKDTRWLNIANNALYIEQWKLPTPLYLVETLTPAQQINERIMTGLRRIEGIAINETLLTAGGKQLTDRQWNEFWKAALQAIKSGNIIYQEHNLKLTSKGLLLADAIAVDLFVD